MVGPLPGVWWKARRGRVGAEDVIRPAVPSPVQAAQRKHAADMLNGQFMSFMTPARQRRDNQSMLK